MAIDPRFLQMKWQNGFESTLDDRVVLTDEYIPMTPVPEGDFGRLVLEDTSKENFEIIRYNRKDAGGVYVETADGGLRNEDGSSSGVHPRGARVRGNITAQDIREMRAATKAVLDEFTAFVANLPDWRPILQVPTVISNLGQKEHIIRYTGVNLTSSIGEGTKLKIPRTGTVPTTSMAFTAASSQYASRPQANVTGLTQTDDITVEALVYMDSYPSTATGCIISRFNGQGWLMRILTNGQVNIYGQNASGYREYGSVQTIPLGRWVHVAAKFDMSANQATIWIDGVAVPGVMSGNGATSFDQSGKDLQVGRFGTTDYFNGRIANIRVWSTLRSDAEIRDNMGRETPISTTGLIAHFKGNGSWNDSSSNANHLTNISGGAVNNFASHPFSATEWAIVNATPTFSGGNTDVRVYTGASFLPNETLGATSFSTIKAPLGFPLSPNKWNIKVRWVGASSQTTPNIASVWGALANTLITKPAGAFDFKDNIYVIGDNSGSNTYLVQSQWVDASLGNYGGVDVGHQYVARANTASGFWGIVHTHEDTFDTPAQTTYQVYLALTGGSGGTQRAYLEGGKISQAVLKCTYL